METIWTFETARFLITASIEPDYGYKYDGDDEDGSTQAALNDGTYVAFDTLVTVHLKNDGGPCLWLGEDNLGGSVYADPREFFTAHRDADPMNRNCTIMRKHVGGSEDAKVCICHYFPDMVREAIRMARDTAADLKVLRLRAA